MRAADAILDLRNFDSKDSLGTEPPTDFPPKKGGGCFGVTDVFLTVIVPLNQ